MKRILSLFSIFLLLATELAQAQVEFFPDTVSRPSRTGRFRLGVVGSKPYLVPRTGPTIPLSGSTILGTVTSVTGAFGSANTVPIPTITKEGLVSSVSTATITPEAIGAPARLALSSLRANAETSPPGAVMLTDVGRSALYLYDPTNTTSADDGGKYLVTTANKRYVLQHPGKSIDAKLYGVTYGSGVSSSVRTANTAALLAALSSGVGIEISNIIETNGTITLNDKNVYLTGLGQYAIIRQMVDANLLVINQTSASTETNIFDVAFEAGGTFSSAAAITHNGYSTPNGGAKTFYQKPFANIERVIIRGSDVYTATTIQHTWKKGIVLSVPNKVTIRDTYITGTWSEANMNGSIGIDMSTTRLAVESVFENIVVANMQTGLIAQKSSVSPALEGLHIDHCSFITVNDGIVLLGSSVYRTPGWFISNCHVAAHRRAVHFEDVNQGKFVNNLVYHYGNSQAGESFQTVFARLYRVSDFMLIGNSFYYQENGATNTPFGLLVEGGSTIAEFAVGNFFAANYISLKSGDNKSGIWLQNYAQNNKVFNNQRVGGNKTVLRNLPYDNDINNNYPADVEESYVTAVLSGTATDPGAVLTRVNPSDPLQGYILSVYHLQAREVIIPSGLIESGSYIKNVTMREGQSVAIRFEATVSVQHSTSLVLEDSRSVRFRAGETLTLLKGSTVEEVSRRMNYKDWQAYDAADNANVTIDGGRTRVFTLVNGTAGTMTITVNMNLLDFGDRFVVKRFATGGTITIQTNTSALIERPDGTLASTYTLPATAAGRQVMFQFTPTGHLELIAN